MDGNTTALVAITLLAATINGALGYGFSSITVPLALLFMANRVLNPALILIEVALNSYVLWVNRAAMPTVWRRVMPIVIGLVPGVVVGTALVSKVSPEWLRFYTYLVLLPLILLQAAGYRRPIRSEISPPIGAATAMRLRRGAMLQTRTRAATRIVRMWGIRGYGSGSALFDPDGLYR